VAGDVAAVRAEAERAQRRLALFASASRALTPDLDFAAIVRALIEVVVPELADYCFFDPALRTPRAPASQIITSVSGAQRHEVLGIGRGGASRFSTRPLTSLVSVPLRARGGTLGVFSICFGESGRHHAEDDLSLAEDLVGLAARAIDGRQLQKDARRAVEELDRERARREAVSRSQQLLVEVGTLLSSSLEYEVTLRRIAQLVVPALADHCLIHMRSAGDGSGDGEIRRMAQAFREPTERTGPTEQPCPLEVAQLSSDNPVLIVLRTGKSILIRDVTDGDLRAAAEDERHLDALRAAHPRSLICVPLAARVRTLGSITLVSSDPERTYDQSDVTIAEEVAQRAAWAVDNALLYEAVERARRRSEEARAESETANRLKDTFLATVSHELRTPMAAILLWESILRTTTDQSMRGRALEAIHQSAVAQSKLIEDLLDVSRCISGKLRIDRGPVAIAPVIAGAVEAALPAAAVKQIRIECICDSTLANVMGDATRLQQVMGNLLSNAIKFTDEGGQVVVRAERKPEQVDISVSDTGRGIRASFLPDIFKPFSQADDSLTRAQSGLGLGLAIVWQLVEMHQGTVRAESPGEGQGSTFTVTLPHLDLPVRSSATPTARERQPSDGVARARRNAARALQRMRIVVVDDAPRVREAIAVVLRDAGAKVTTTASAEEAMAVLRRGRWDVVVSDIGMPGEDGYTFLRRLRRLPAEEGGDVPAVALTAYARAQDKERAAEAGFDLHLTKPVDATELIVAIANLARGSAVPAAQV